MISATVRDVAIILVAFEILIMNGLLVVLIWQIWRLVKMIQVEIKPVIKDGQETVGTVKGSADFVSASFIGPLISASSRLAGFRRSVQVIRSELQSSMATVTLSRPPSTPAPDADSSDPAPQEPPPAV